MLDVQLSNPDSPHCYQRTSWKHQTNESQSLRLISSQELNPMWRTSMLALLVSHSADLPLLYQYRHRVARVLT